MGSASQKKWLGIISGWQESGLTKAEYCRQKSINLRKFSYHSVKNQAFSKSREAKKAESESFVKVVTDDSVTRIEAPLSGCVSSLVLRLDGGMSVELRKDFDADLLRRILEVARDLS